MATTYVRPLSFPASPSRPTSHGPQSPPKVGLGVQGVEVINEEKSGMVTTVTSPHDLTRFVSAPWCHQLYEGPC